MTDDLFKEFEYLRKLRAKAQEYYDVIDNSENFKFSMSHIIAVFNAIKDVELEMK